LLGLLEEFLLLLVDALSHIRFFLDGTEGLLLRDFMHSLSVVSLLSRGLLSAVGDRCLDLRRHVGQLARSLPASDGLVLLPRVLLSLQVLEEVVKLLLRRDIIIAFLLVLTYTFE